MLSQPSTLWRTLKPCFHWRARPLLRSLRHGIVAIDSDLETCFSSDISWLPSVTTTYPVDRITRILERQCICVRPSFTLFHVSFSVSLNFSALLPPRCYISRIVPFALAINSSIFTRHVHAFAPLVFIYIFFCLSSNPFIPFLLHLYVHYICIKINYVIEKINAIGLFN